MFFILGFPIVILALIGVRYVLYEHILPAIGASCHSDDKQ